MPVLGHRRLGLERGEHRAALLAQVERGIENLLHRGGRPREDIAGSNVEQQQIALADQPPHVAHAPQYRHAHRPRDDRDVRGQRSFFEDHPLQPPPVIFEEFRRTQIARDQDRVLPEAHLRRSAHLARDGAQQPVRQILQIVHPVGQQRIVDLPHPHPGALLDALDRRLSSQAAVDRLVDATAPALVIGEHLVGLEHLFMLAADAEFGLRGDPLDLRAHLVERGIDAVALGLGILGDGMLDMDARLVEHGVPARHALDELQPHDPHRRGRLRAHRRGATRIDQFGIGDQLGQHHRDGLQRLDLDLVIAARIDMLDRQHADRALAPDDRDAGEAAKLLLARLGILDEVGVARRFVEVEDLGLLRDRADQPLAKRQFGDVDRLLRKTTRGVEFEHAFAQQVDRAHFARHAFADDRDDGVELGLRRGARGHHVVETNEDFAGGGGCSHPNGLTDWCGAWLSCAAQDLLLWSSPPLQGRGRGWGKPRRGQRPIRPHPNPSPEREGLLVSYRTGFPARLRAA